MSEINKSPWPGPKGLIPVTSGKAEDANVYNRNFLDSIHMEMRVIDSLEPDLTTKVFGVEYASPIMMPAFSHLNKVGKDGKKPMIEYAKAAKELNVLNWVGMEPNEEYAEISHVGANTVRIIKPFADHSIIIDQIKFAKEHGIVAVGIDIDHVAGTDGKYDVVDGIPMGPVLLEDLKEYVKIAEIPFVAKGVLSVQDAIKAKEAGCSAIVVSHHHGRIPFGIAPLQILPRICGSLASLSSVDKLPYEHSMERCKKINKAWKKLTSMPYFYASLINSKITLDELYKSSIFIYSLTEWALVIPMAKLTDL